VNLTKWDRDVVAIWREAGEIPDGHTAQETALEILGRLIDDLDEMHAILDQLGAEVDS